jgi:hypothetical protein
VRRVLSAFLVLGLASCGSLTDLHAIQGRGGDADRALENGVRRLLEQPAVGFSYSVATSTEEFSVTLSGTVDFTRPAWLAKGRLSTTAPGDAQDFELRSIGHRRWIGFANRPGGRLCWYPMSEDRELEGLPAIDAGVPGFVSVLDKLQYPEWQLGEKAWLTARLGLRDAAMLASTFELTTSELTPKDGSLGVVRVTVGLADGVLHELTINGGELASAFDQGGAALPEKAARDLETRDVRLTFGGVTQSVRAPDPSRVYDGVHRRPGCQPPANANA